MHMQWGGWGEGEGKNPKLAPCPAPCLTRGSFSQSCGHDLSQSQEPMFNPPIHQGAGEW